MNKTIKNLGIILFFVLILNLIWEFSHYRLYNDLSAITGAPHLILASIVDVFLVLLIYFLVSLKNRNFDWINQPSFFDYGFLIIFGLIIAWINEIISLSLGKWAYKDSMPVIFGVGLSPLIQLSITFLLALVIYILFKK